MTPFAALRDMELPGDGGPSVGELQGDNHFVRIARDNWLSSSAGKLRPEVLKRDIWDVLESENFRFRSLLILENLQILEKYGALMSPSWLSPLTFTDRYLWPTYTEDASNFQVLLIVLIVDVKSREKVPIWGKG